MHSADPTEASKATAETKIAAIFCVRVGGIEIAQRAN